MDYTGYLLVGTFPVASAEPVEDELLAVFRDDILQVRPVPAEQYEQYMSVTGPEIESAVFRAPGPVIADRLDAMGMDAASVLADLDRTLKGAAEPATEADLAEYGDEARASVRAEEELLSAMSAQDWVARLAATPDDPDAVYDKSPGSRGWLVNLLDSEDGWDTLRRLRAILLAFPDADVTIDVTWLGEYGWRESEPTALASNAQAAVRDKTTVHAPVIVLTEGTTDAEFLSTALSVLHPHLTDLVRFLDYAPGAVKGGEHVRFQRMRDAGGQVAVLGQHAGRQDEHLLEGRRPRLDLQHLYLPSGLISTVIHPPIMPPGGRGLRPEARQPEVVIRPRDSRQKRMT